MLCHRLEYFAVFFNSVFDMARNVELMVDLISQLLRCFELIN